jgi:CRISPR-associated protein Csh2
MSNIISNNSDFLFLFDATQCNPNGDIDQENKPRMDYDTDTNLVSDTRVKRTIRDYLRQVKDKEIFVDMEGEAKVNGEMRMKSVIKQLASDENFEKVVLTDEMKAIFIEIKKKIGDKVTTDELANFMISKKNEDLCQNINRFILAHVIKNKFIDIRMFGGAFAIKGVNKPYTGPIQLNWGYSLHKVKIMDSNSIVTIMSDDNSTIGKDYRVHYSLLAFNGTINKFAAKSTELTTTDVEDFRDAIWSSIAALPTRSKLNQYSKMYVEIVYNNGYSNGQFGDLRQYVKAIPKVEEDAIRNFNDLTLDVSALKNLIEADKAKEEKDRIIKEVIIRTTTGNTL